jgi:CD109 antigen
MLLQDTGAFAERGEVHHKAMQGGASEGGLALTAYVLIAMLENQVLNDKARLYLESHLAQAKDDPYTLSGWFFSLISMFILHTIIWISVVSYALHLANSQRKAAALKMLEAHQVAGSDGSMHWSTAARTKSEISNNSRSEPTTWTMSPIQPADIEATSYALLTYMLIGDVEKGLPIVRWLTAQRNGAF